LHETFVILWFQGRPKVDFSSSAKNKNATNKQLFFAETEMKVKNATNFGRK